MSHATLSPSKAARWMACPGSVREEARYPDESGPAAVDGTHTHTLLEHCIKGGLGDPTSMVGVRLKDHEGEFVVDADRAARVKVAIEYIRQRVVEAPLFEILAERRVDPAYYLGRSDLSGTADVQIRTPGVLEIIDYKDGMGIVEAAGNPQLELYALGALASLGVPINQDTGYHTVRMTIVQPKLMVKGLPAVSSHEVKVTDLLAKLGNYVLKAAATDAPDAPLVAGDHCKFCKHKGACSALAGQVMKEVGVMFPQVTQPTDVVEIAQQSANKDPATMDNDQLRQIVEAAPLMRQLLEAAEKEVQRRLESGQTIPGLKLVHGRGSRAWVLPEEEMADKLIRMGIPKSAVYVTKLVSPAQVEKLTWEKTKGGEKVKASLSERQLKTLETEYVSKVAGKLTVAPESDSRPAVVTNAAPMFSAVEPPVEQLPAWLLPV
jgi:hypothetical protein